MATSLDHRGDEKVLTDKPHKNGNPEGGTTEKTNHPRTAHNNHQPHGNHFQHPFSRRKVTQATLAFPMNNNIAFKVISTLTSMGVSNTRIAVAKWSDKRFYALANFAEACEDKHLPKDMGGTSNKCFPRRPASKILQCINPRLPVELLQKSGTSHKQTPDSRTGTGIRFS